MVFGCAQLTIMSANDITLLIRHAPVQIDPSRPSQEWMLSEEGRRKCELFSNKLIEYHLSLFITSQETKAVETGKIFAAVTNLPIKSVPGLAEQRRLTAPYFKSEGHFKDAIEKLFTYPDKLVFGEETANEALFRFQRAIENEQFKHPNANTAFVTHGTVMTLFICHHNPNLPPVSLWNQLTLPCAAVLERPDFKLKKLILS